MDKHFLPIEDEPFCVNCDCCEYEVCEHVVAQDNSKVLSPYVQCTHLYTCRRLWDHLNGCLDYCDESIDDDFFSDDDPDWCFSQDASYEDRQT